VIGEIIRCYDIFRTINELLSEAAFLHFIVEPALFVELHTCADVTEAQILWRDMRHGIVVIHEAESVSFEVVVEFVRKYFIAHTRRAERV